jgi:hypothetical protein
MSTASSWIVVLLLAAATAGSAQAQDQPQNQNQTVPDSRAALLTAEREKKATEITPPQRSKIERALYR